MRKNVVVYLVILLFGIVGGVILSKFVIFDNNTDNKNINNNSAEELVNGEGKSDEVQSKDDDVNGSKILVDIKYADDVVKIDEIIRNLEYSINVDSEKQDLVVKELYGKDKVLITDIDKRILKSYAFTTFLHSSYANVFYMNYVERENGYWIYDADELNKEVLNRYKYLFKDGNMDYDSIPGCPEFKYNSQDKKYYGLGSCGYSNYKTDNYKYEFNSDEYIVYRHVTYDKLSIDNNYKLTFRFGENDKGEKVCLPSPYCFDLYSIEKIS